MTVAGIPESLPEADHDLSGDKLLEFDRNLGCLIRYGRTEHAKKEWPNGIPARLAQLFCERVSGFYNGGSLQDVTGVLKDLAEEIR